jgi:serine protease
MKAKKITFIFIVALFLALGIFLSVRAGTQASSTEEFVPNEVLLRFKDKADFNSIKNVLAIVQGQILTSAGREISADQWNPLVISNRSFVLDERTFHIRVPETLGTERAIEILKSNPNIEYAERNNIFHAFVNPNDTRFIDLWGLRNVGQSGGTVDADIDAPEAWDIYTGNPDMVVAIIDSGIDYNHVDLASNIWINSDEIPGNGLDDDANGYIDDDKGWNFVLNDNDPFDDLADVYHGTHVAGTYRWCWE